MAEDTEKMSEEKPGAPSERAAPVEPVADAGAGSGGGESDDSVAAAPAAETAASRRRSRGARHVPAGIAHITATFNNTIVSITDLRGGVVSWCSGGRAGFRGSRKSTAFAATVVAQDAARQAIGRGMHEVEVRVQGAGSGRDSAVRGLQSAGLNITIIRDMTPIPHNGCRQRKRRRV